MNNFYIKDLDMDTSKRFRAACALEGMTIAQAMEQLMKGYADKVLAEEHKKVKK